MKVYQKADDFFKWDELKIKKILNLGNIIAQLAAFFFVFTIFFNVLGFHFSSPVKFNFYWGITVLPFYLFFLGYLNWKIKPKLLPLLHNGRYKFYEYLIMLLSSLVALDMIKLSFWYDLYKRGHFINVIVLFFLISFILFLYPIWFKILYISKKFEGYENALQWKKINKIIISLMLSGFIFAFIILLIFHKPIIMRLLFLPVGFFVGVPLLLCAIYLFYKMFKGNNFLTILSLFYFFTIFYVGNFLIIFTLLFLEYYKIAFHIYLSNNIAFFFILVFFLYIIKTIYNYKKEKGSEIEI